MAAWHWRGVIKDVELRNGCWGRTPGKNGLVLSTKNQNDTEEKTKCPGENYQGANKLKKKKTVKKK